MPIPSHPNLGLILRQLHASEINFTIESFHDAGWKLTLGDAKNGVEALASFGSDELVQVPRWLVWVACTHYPESEFARIYDLAPAND